MKIWQLIDGVLVTLLAMFIVVCFGNGCALSATPVEVINQHWEPIGPIMCRATSERVRVCTDSRELSYHWVCEDRGTWHCAKVSRR